MERMGLNDMYLSAMLTPILNCKWIPENGSSQKQIGANLKQDQQKPCLHKT